MKRILLFIAMVTLSISPMSVLASQKNTYYNISNQETTKIFWGPQFELIDPQGIEIEMLDMLLEFAGGYERIMLLQDKKNPNERVIMIDSYDNTVSNIKFKALSGTEEGLKSWSNLTNKLSEISEFLTEVLVSFEESSDYNYSIAIQSSDRKSRVIYLVKDGEVIVDEMLSIDKRKEHNINY